MSENPETVEQELYEEFGDTPTSYVDIPAMLAGLTLDEWELWVSTVGVDRVVPVTRADMWELIAQLRTWKQGQQLVFP